MLKSRKDPIVKIYDYSDIAILVLGNCSKKIKNVWG